MGVYINLDIMADKIDKGEWTKVYEESLELVKEYPFLTLLSDDFHGIERVLVDTAKEQYYNKNQNNLRFWSVNGDLNTKRRGETFSLYSDINVYNHKEKYDKQDILECFLHEDFPEKSVFDSKTQGEDYHIYVLAIACLIESRFPNYAVTYGDINRDQVKKAIDWANSILKEPINLPVRVDAKRLVDRLELIKNKTQCIGKTGMLEAFTDLIITEDFSQYGELIREKFNKAEIISFFTNKLNCYKSGIAVGAERIMIDFLNQDNDFGDLCDICCINEDGPKYDCIDFAKTIASIRMFIKEDKEMLIDITSKSLEKPKTTMEQFASVFLDMSGMAGRRINRYISLEDTLRTIKEKFEEAHEMEKIIRKSCEFKEDNLSKMEELINKENMNEKNYEDINNKECIYTTEMLIHWNEKSILSEPIERFLNRIKAFIDEEFINNRENGVILDADDKISIIKMIIRGTRHAGIILSRNAWDWIERENNLDILKKIALICIMRFSRNTHEAVVALLKNRSMFYKYMIV